MTNNQSSESTLTPARLRGRQRLEQAHVYLCTDGRRERGDFAAFIEAAYRGGVDVIQLRDKSMDAREEIEVASVLSEVAHRMGKLFAINDRADVAALVNADILHVGQADLTTPQARAIVGEDMLMGRSNRTSAMFEQSLNDPGIDYAVIGPVWNTATHPDRAAVGVETVREAAMLGRAWQETSPVSKTCWAIGGIDVDQIPAILDAGMERVAVVRAITLAADPELAARTLRQALSL